MVKPDDVGEFTRWFGKSVLLVSGDDWVRQHSVFSQIFTPKRIAAFIPTIVECAKEDLLQPLAATSGSGESFQIAVPLKNMTVDFTCKAIWGHMSLEGTATLRRLLSELMELVIHPLAHIPILRSVPIPVVTKLNRCLAEARQFVEEAILQYIQEGKRQDEATKGLMQVRTKWYSLALTTFNADDG